VRWGQAAVEGQRPKLGVDWVQASADDVAVDPVGQIAFVSIANQIVTAGGIEAAVDIAALVAGTDRVDQRDVAVVAVDTSGEEFGQSARVAIVGERAVDHQASASLDNAQAIANPDGTYTLVISPTGAPSIASGSNNTLLMLVNNGNFTFFINVEGNSMVGAGIHDTDILVVDRAIDAVNNSIVIAVLNGNFTVKRIQFREQEILLLAEHPRYPLLKVTEQDTFSIWGVVTYSIHTVGARLTRGPIVPSRSQPPQR